jgi:MinD-like ATPase involved in chromosome partitioning or flagellar assembly
MARERWVLLGLAETRAAWFRDVAQWATSASIPAEFVKCVSAEDVRARLRSGRPHSALLVDASLTAFDRDLVAAAQAAYTPVIAVSDGRGASWSPADLGVAAVLPADFGRNELMEVLSAAARPIGRGDQLPPQLAEVVSPPWRCPLVVVCGPGGTGASTVAVALAQGLAAEARYGGRVLLADLARCADQAMLHDAGELGPGIQELVEAHRTGHPDPSEVRSYTYDVPVRGYRLLLGLRRPSAWSALRPRATDAAIDGLRRSFQLVVADVTADLEGEADGGSIDVEERNHLARATVADADVVVAVGAPGMKGVHSLAGLVRTLAANGAGPRILPVVNRAPRHPGTRSEIATALARLVSTPLAAATPLWIPDRRVDDALRHGAPIPGPVTAPLTAAVAAVLDRTAGRPPAAPAPLRVTPGTLGRQFDR